MTFTEARQQIERARDAAPAVLATTIDAVGRAAVDRLAGASPRDSGLLAESWVWGPPVLGNSAPYASFVHDGLVFRMVPEALDELAPAFESVLTSELDAAVGW